MKFLGFKALCLFYFAFIFSGCSNGNSAPRDNSEEKEKKEASIFHQEIALNLGDSLDIRILSWGGKETGSYLVLVADSAGRHYVGDSFFRSGNLKDAWADDLDRDGRPEIGVVLKEQSERKYASLKLHELSKSFDFRTITMPALNEAMGSDYGGFDTLYRSGQEIVREFSLLNRADSTIENPARRQIIYHFENKQLVPGENTNLPLPEQGLE